MIRSGKLQEQTDIHARLTAVGPESVYANDRNLYQSGHAWSLIKTGESAAASQVIEYSSTYGRFEAMTKNEGSIDRALRVLVGLGLIALALTGTIGVWGWIGVLPLVTGLVGWCPAYSVFGLKTLKSS